MKPLRLTLVGCGTVTQTGHLPAAIQSPLIDIHALVDVHLEIARKLQRQHDLNCIVTKDIESALVDSQGVLIATPNHTHLPIGMQVLEHGLPVLMEKPLAIRFEDCQSLCALAHQKKTLLAVGYRTRHYPSVQLLKHLLDTEYLGPVRSFCYESGDRSIWNTESGFVLDQKSAGGGTLIDSHLLDKVFYWFGEPTRCEYWDDSHGGPEANCKIAMDFESPRGSFSGIALLSRSVELSNKICIETDSHICELHEFEPNELRVFLKGHPDLECRIRSRKAPQLEGGPSWIDTSDSFRLQIENFARAIQNQASILVDGESASQSIAWFEQMYANRSPLEEPWLPGPNGETSP